MIETYRNEIPNWVLEDDTFLFHGTSNLSEQSLDNGFTDSFSFLPLDIIQKIIAIYEDMNWGGIAKDGFGVLKNYSNKDHHQNGKYFFLGETPSRCSLYASNEFAGGEFIRSVYLSIIDLVKYLSDVQIREKHKCWIEKEYPFTGEIYNVDLRELVPKIESMKPIFKDLESQRNDYKYGLIYCYKIEKEDYPSLIYSKYGMGFKVLEPLPLDRLKVKLIFDPPVENYFSDRLLDKLTTERVISWSKKIQRY